MTFKALVALPDRYGAAELEVISQKLIEFLGSAEMDTMNITWACPELGRQTIPPGPVLVFSSRTTDGESRQ